MRKLLRIVALVAGLTLFAAVAACSPAENEGAASAVYYTVTFDAQGGSEVESRSVLAGNPVRRPANPVRAEYSFVGWFDEAEGGERWDFDTDRVTEDLTLYAHWNELPAEGGIRKERRKPRRNSDRCTETKEKKRSILPIASRYFGDPSPEASGKKAKRSCFAFFCGGRGGIRKERQKPRRNSDRCTESKEKKRSILPIASRYFGDPSPEASGKKAKRSCFAFFCGGR